MGFLPRSPIPETDLPEIKKVFSTAVKSQGESNIKLRTSYYRDPSARSQLTEVGKDGERYEDKPGGPKFIVTHS